MIAKGVTGVKGDVQGRHIMALAAVRDVNKKQIHTPPAAIIEPENAKTDIRVGETIESGIETEATVDAAIMMNALRDESGEIGVTSLMTGPVVENVRDETGIENDDEAHRLRERRNPPLI